MSGSSMVEVVGTELVFPNEETPKHRIWLSNLDLAARRGYTPAIYFYRPNGDPDFFSADALKAGLSKVLVPFYPFAGRLAEDEEGRIEIDCSAEGAVFIAARTDRYSLDDLADFAPSAEMRDLFVPPADDPRVLLMVQVTRLRCGGVVLGTAMQHAVLDARSACHFMGTWGALARGSGGSPADDPVVPPFLDRTPLRARSPPAVTYDHVEYKPDRSALPPGASSDYAAAILTLSRRQVEALKARCGPAGASAFRAIVAHVWRCACAARGLAPEEETRLYTMIDMRSRLVPPLPPSYFGNAVLRTSVAARVEEVVSAPVGSVARRVRGATSQGDEYARSLIDCLESTDMMRLPRSGVARSSLRVISWMGMPMYDADFGWGEPTFMGPALMYYSGFVYLMNSPRTKDDDGGGVAVIVSLEPDTLPAFKKLFFQELC